MIGAPFYLMEHLDGVVVRERVPAPLSDSATAGADCAFAMMDALAGIHAFAWEAGGLGDYGRPDGYLERQVPRWLGQLDRYRTRDLPEVDEAGRWLQAHTPTMKEATVIHGDYKLDNLMFEAALPVTVQAVVDWEQSTIGDPLVDVGWVIGLWTEPGDRGALAGPSPLGAGAPARSALIDRYADATGRDLTDLPFYCVLGLFKLACVMEGSVRAFQCGDERRRVLRDAVGRRAGAGAPCARVRRRSEVTTRRAGRRSAARGRTVRCPCARCDRRRPT